jgi:putative thioredoxin
MDASGSSMCRRRPASIPLVGDLLGPGTLAEVSVIDVQQSDFADLVLAESSRRPVVVDFWAAWCGPCKVLGPLLERLAGESAGSWLLAKVDVDANPELASRFGVQGIPTVVAFVGGEPVNRFTGALPEAQVRAFIEAVVPSELDAAAAAADEAFEAGRSDEAERAYRAILDVDAGHQAAGVGLATVLLDRNDAEAALEVLANLPRSEEVRRLESAARLWSSSGDVAALAAAARSGTARDRLAYARALAVDGDAEEAMELLVQLVAERDDLADEARLTLLDLFEILGQEHALVSQYRRKLASALF